MAREVILEIAGLGVRRDGRALLEGVTFSVTAGQVHVVVGPNGAGKSTLVQALLGQVPFAGQIRFHWAGSGRIGYVPQAFELDRTLPITVGEFLALSRQRAPVCFGVRKATRQCVERLLEQVGLAGFAGRRLGVLSGGEVRRVLVANAIDPVPELLLCDEPASGMDPAAVESLDALLLGLRAQHGTSVLLVSHDVQQVRRVADRVTLLDRCVRLEGSADEVLPRSALPSFSRLEAPGQVAS